MLNSNYANWRDTNVVRSILLSLSLSLYLSVSISFSFSRYACGTYTCTFVAHRKRRMKSSLALIRSSGLDIGAVGVCIIRTYVACIWPSAGLALIRVIFSFFIARRDIRERERERRRTRCRIHTQRVVNIWYYEGTSAANFKFFFLSFSFPGTSAGLFIWSFLMTKMRLIDTLGRWGNARPRGFFFFFASHTCVCRKCLSREILSDRKTSSYETN